KGFVYKRVPHIMLSTIAKNPEIDAISDLWQQRLEPVRERMNGILNQSWEEWEVPRLPDERWPLEANDLWVQWWSLKRDRQREIDASIVRCSEAEMLYDQPYEDPKKIRVTGPFTVESLSPFSGNRSGDGQKARA